MFYRKRSRVMFLRRKPWFLFVLGCACTLIAGLLAMEISNRKLDAQVRDREASKAADSPKKATAADLQSRVEQLEKELQNLKRNGFLFGLPRSRDDDSKPDPIEIQIMRTLVESRLQTWQRCQSEGKKSVK